MSRDYYKTHARHLGPGDRVDLLGLAADLKRDDIMLVDWMQYPEERQRAGVEYAGVDHVTTRDENSLIEFENFPAWCVPADTIIRVYSPEEHHV